MFVAKSSNGVVVVAYGWCRKVIQNGHPALIAAWKRFRLPAYRLGARCATADRCGVAGGVDCTSEIPEKRATFGQNRNAWSRRGVDFCGYCVSEAKKEK